MSSPTRPPPRSAQEEAIRMLLKTRISVGTNIAEVESRILATSSGEIGNHYLATQKLAGLSKSNETDPWKELDPDFLLLKLANFLKTLPSPTATSAEVRDYLVTFPCEEYAVNELDQHFLLSISRLDITGAEIQAMSYCELRLYLLDAGFKGPATTHLLPAYEQAVEEVYILKEIQMLVFKRANPNRFTRVDTWNFLMMAMAPFWMFYCAYLVKTEKAALICIILGVLYSLYWVFVLFFGLERARFWKEWK